MRFRSGSDCLAEKRAHADKILGNHTAEGIYYYLQYNTFAAIFPDLISSQHYVNRSRLKKIRRLVLGTCGLPLLPGV